MNLKSFKKIIFGKSGFTIEELIDLGRQHYKSLRYKKALKYFKEAAHKGDIIAHFFVGEMYDKGEGVPQDFKQAVYWYTKAAYQGDVSSQCRLAKMYLDGEGIAKDNDKARYWFTKAGEHGCLGAPLHLRKK